MSKITKEARRSRVHLVAPGEPVVHLVDVHERVKRGTPASVIATEIGVANSVLSRRLGEAGFANPSNRGRPRADRRA